MFAISILIIMIIIVIIIIIILRWDYFWGLFAADGTMGREEFGAGQVRA